MLNRYNTSTATLEQDALLKQVIESRISNGESRYDWSTVVPEEPHTTEDIVVSNHQGEVAFKMGLVASTIGEALTDLLIAKGDSQEDQIFNETNRGLVKDTAEAVTKSILSKVEQGGQLKLSRQDLYLLIEKALIEKNRHDIAKSLIFYRQFENSGGFKAEAEPVQIKLTRRNGAEVPWNASKIESAVGRAFLTEEEDPAPAREIALAISHRVGNSGVEVIDIEQVQDLVQEELMRQGYYNVAQHYILYRAQHSRLRSKNQEQTQDDPLQETMVVVQEEDGSSTFWDGLDLRRRIEFASEGLDLALSKKEIELELRRSLNTEVTRDDLKKLIILNAKSLLEQDADFAKFAGRILLSYIYEEVLDWSIVKDGPETLKEAHQKGFINYIQYGIKINRLSPDLLEYDLDRVSAAIDPSSDLDFEFLGVSTLYDRYLIIDKTGKKHRRLETPQFFWLRVALGLFKEEPKDKETLAINLYDMYRSRRF